MTAPARTALIASSDALYADLAAAYLTDIAGWTIVGVVPADLRAIAATARLNPSAVLVIGGSASTGKGAVADQLRQRWPQLAVVVAGGATGPADPDAVVAALGRLPAAVSVKVGDAAPLMELVARLTRREQAVLRRLALGAEPDVIASELGVSAFTVRTHIQNLYDKLDCHSRIDVVRIAGACGLLRDGGPGGFARS